MSFQGPCRTPGEFRAVVCLAQGRLRGFLHPAEAKRHQNIHSAWAAAAGKLLARGIFPWDWISLIIHKVRAQEARLENCCREKESPAGAGRRRSDRISSAQPWLHSPAVTDREMWAGAAQDDGFYGYPHTVHPGIHLLGSQHCKDRLLLLKADDNLSLLAGQWWHPPLGSVLPSVF